jgi:hypothetical protein
VTGDPEGSEQVIVPGESQRSETGRRACAERGTMVRW